MSIQTDTTNTTLAVMDVAMFRWNSGAAQKIHFTHFDEEIILCERVIQGTMSLSNNYSTKFDLSVHIGHTRQGGKTFPKIIEDWSHGYQVNVKCPCITKKLDFYSFFLCFLLLKVVGAISLFLACWQPLIIPLKCWGRRRYRPTQSAAVSPVIFDKSC